ncbi:crotonase/enoyl-CoA hydratase family protein [Terricaulis silvestris]|uniref:Carnitinyl-CoA dehydratase n=1 Tax=Terricaulis silvestris TaxID=2686094 RepID=A0A6I6MGD2_9CAUL|nr:crotonase/enoyl-CoA hydratase family protein [Terricaulis silvestris]QGZ93670.1 Carnitinyl-CoA dehydratase [Terricaulis silvestris]
MAAVHTRREGPVLIVTIDRPEAKNAIDAAGAALINAAMDELDNDTSLFLGVITGAGGAFSAGADLKAASRGGPAARADRGPFGLCETPPGKPLIAAVEGVAFGGGFEICLACDLVVAVEDAQFALPEVKHNLVALGGGAIRLPRRLPYHVAMEMALTGAAISARELQAYGLVNRLAAPGSALAEALSLARELLRNGPTALAATARIMRASAAAQEESLWRTQRELAALALTATDRAEALQAFAERRPPRWTGH